MEKTCKLCKYFVQHYRREKRGYYDTVNCGHCKFPRLKNRKPDFKACEHFVEKFV